MRYKFIEYIMCFGLEGDSLISIFKRFCDFQDLQDEKYSKKFYSSFVKYVITFISLLFKIETEEEKGSVIFCGLDVIFPNPIHHFTIASEIIETDSRHPSD